jgi:hypothetical protein
LEHSARPILFRTSTVTGALTHDHRRFVQLVLGGCVPAILRE